MECYLCTWTVLLPIYPVYTPHRLTGVVAGSAASVAALLAALAGRNYWGALQLNSNRVRPTPKLPGLFDWLIGQRCTSVERSEQTYSFVFGDSRLNVHSLWRISDATNILVTSEDDAQRFGLPAPIDARQRAQELLRDLEVRSVTVDVQKGDLTIAFAQSRLEVINDSSGYEPWTIHAPKMDIIAASGGKVQILAREV